MTPRFAVATREGRYPVFCGNPLGETLQAVWDPRWRGAAVIGDSNTLPLFGPVIEDALRPRVDLLASFSFPAGDVHKTRETKMVLEDQLLAAGFDRGSCVVAVGGGVALDMAGFVAATYLRGVSHLNVATSLLAQVDASIGGKTGVNTTAGKNLVGAFQQPNAVLLHTRALSSLPEEELRNGLAEAIKHAAIADIDLFETLEDWAASGSQVPDSELVGRCAAIKAEIVAEDEREQGRRAVLNFGHSVAHALEASSEHKIPHGRAVGVGLVLESRLALALGRMKEQDCGRLESLLRNAGLPTKPPCPYEHAAPFLTRDKKNRQGRLHFSLPSGLGRFDARDGQWTCAVDQGLVAKVWQEAV